MSATKGPETMREARRADRIKMRSGKLSTLLEHRSEIDRQIADCVRGLRRDNTSWAHIGELLGVSRQAAEQRYSRNKR